MYKEDFCPRASFEDARIEFIPIELIWVSKGSIATRLPVYGLPYGAPSNMKLTLKLTGKAMLKRTTYQKGGISGIPFKFSPVGRSVVGMQSSLGHKGYFLSGALGNQGRKRGTCIFFLLVSTGQFVTWIRGD